LQKTNTQKKGERGRKSLHKLYNTKVFFGKKERTQATRQKEESRSEVGREGEAYAAGPGQKLRPLKQRDANQAGRPGGTVTFMTFRKTTLPYARRRGRDKYNCATSTTLELRENSEQTTDKIVTQGEGQEARGGHKKRLFVGKDERTVKHKNDNSKPNTAHTPP